MGLPKYTMLYPNKENPQAYRVQCKLIKSNRYFYFREYGSEKNALAEATIESGKVLERLKLRRIKLELMINILFDGDYIRGMTIVNDKRNNGYRLTMYTRIDGKSTLVGDRGLKANSPKEAIEMLFEKALTMHNVKMSHEIKPLYLKAKMNMVDKIIIKCGIDG